MKQLNLGKNKLKKVGTTMGLAFMAIFIRINTGIILRLLFYFIFTAISLGLRLFGHDLLNRKIDQKKESYWIKKEKAVFNVQAYLKQF